MQKIYIVDVRLGSKCASGLSYDYSISLDFMASCDWKTLCSLYIGWSNYKSMYWTHSDWQQKRCILNRMEKPHNSSGIEKNNLMLSKNAKTWYRKNKKSTRTCALGHQVKSFPPREGILWIPVDLITSTEEIFNWKLHFLCSVTYDIILIFSSILALHAGYILVHKQPLLNKSKHNHHQIYIDKFLVDSSLWMVLDLQFYDKR